MVVAMPISTKAFVMARAKANKSNLPIRPDDTNVTVDVAHVWKYRDMECIPASVG